MEERIEVWIASRYIEHMPLLFMKTFNKIYCRFQDSEILYKLVVDQSKLYLQEVKE